MTTGTNVAVPSFMSLRIGFVMLALSACAAQFEEPQKQDWDGSTLESNIAAATVALINHKGKTVCSGTMIAEDMVLTAAHCLPLGGATIASVAQRADGYDAGFRSAILGASIHKGYWWSVGISSPNDIAVIQVEQPFYGPTASLPSFIAPREGNPYMLAGFNGLNYAEPFVWSVLPMLRPAPRSTQMIHMQAPAEPCSGSCEEDGRRGREVCQGTSGGAIATVAEDGLEILAVLSGSSDAGESKICSAPSEELSSAPLAQRSNREFIDAAIQDLRAFDAAPDARIEFVSLEAGELFEWQPPSPNARFRLETLNGELRVEASTPRGACVVTSGRGLRDAIQCQVPLDRALESAGVSLREVNPSHVAVSYSES